MIYQRLALTVAVVLVATPIAVVVATDRGIRSITTSSSTKTIVGAVGGVVTVSGERIRDPKRHRYLSGTKSDKSDKSKKSKKAKKKTKAPTASPTPAPTSDLQPGYEYGMKIEIEGSWAGEEKFSSADCPGPFDYCSTAIFDPRGPLVDDVVDPQNFLIFQSGFLGDTGTESCLTAGVNTITGDVDGNWLRILDPFYYILQIEQKKCLTEAECPFNIVEEIDTYSNYNILEQSCGSHLKVDRLNGLRNCELFHVNLLEEKTTGEKLVVNVLSYSGGVEGGYGAVECPTIPTFDLDALNADPNMDGILLFVKQGCIDTSTDASGCVVTSTDDWECKFGGSDPTEAPPVEDPTEAPVVDPTEAPVAAPTGDDD